MIAFTNRLIKSIWSLAIRIVASIHYKTILAGGKNTWFVTALGAATMAFMFAYLDVCVALSYVSTKFGTFKCLASPGPQPDTSLHAAIPVMLIAALISYFSATVVRGYLFWRSSDKWDALYLRIGTPLNKGRDKPKGLFGLERGYFQMWGLFTFFGVVVILALIGFTGQTLTRIVSTFSRASQ